LVLIENEFGEIGIDGGFLQDAGVTVNEMNSGCICCSLTGDFRQALHMVSEQYHPDRIIIEPSGVGKLSEIVAAVQTAGTDEFTLGGLTTVVDATRAKLYMKNFGEFFNNQVQSANCIVLSRTGSMTEEKIAQAVALLREKNPQAVIVSTDWAQLTGRQILDAIEQKNTISSELEALLQEHFEDEECDDPDCCCHHHHDDDEEHDHEHHHHHDHDDDDHDHEHHHHHDHDDDHDHEHHHHDHDDDHDHEHHHHDHDHDDDHDHEHHHHDHDDDDHDHEHHHHDHDHHHHHHHHGHDADEVFQSWGAETAKKFTAQELESILTALENQEKYGFIVRAKGYVPTADGTWLHFDYTPGERDIRTGPANVAGRVCVIGAGLQEDAAKELFAL
jgi:G3E family GTPase